MRSAVSDFASRPVDRHGPIARRYR